MSGNASLVMRPFARTGNDAECSDWQPLEAHLQGAAERAAVFASGYVEVVLPEGAAGNTGGHQAAPPESLLNVVGSSPFGSKRQR